MIKWMKNHKWTVTIIIIFLIMMFVLSKVYDLVVVNRGKPVYGDRIENIKSIEITKTNVNNLKAGIKESPKVKDVAYSLAGKVITVRITMLDDASLEEAKTAGNKVLEYFDKEQQSNYGIQVFLLKDGDDLKFPVVGYKHYTNAKISWTKDR